MELKHWKFIENTPAFGKAYHHVSRKVIIIVYSDKIKLFRDFDEGQAFYACFAQTKLERLFLINC